MLQGQLPSGAPLGIEVSGGRPPDADTTFEVTGTQATLTLRGGAIRGVQSGRIHPLLNGEPQSIEEGEMSSMPDAAVNPAGIYPYFRNGQYEKYERVADCSQEIHNVYYGKASATCSQASWATAFV